MGKFLRYVVIIFCVGSFFSANATHNRAGEITYKWMYGTTYGFTLTTYTADGPQIADRCRDTIYFGDGAFTVVERSNGPLMNSDCGITPAGQTFAIIPNFKKNVYITTHTYNGPGTFKVYMFDRNRNAGVINIPGSVNQPFYLEALIKINQFGGANSSAQFTFLPYDDACLGKCFYHNPGAFDPDGDSLSYELTTCKGEDPVSGTIGVTIPGYSFPDPGNGGTYNIHPTTGTLTWCTPQLLGEYNAAFIVKEWRKNYDGVYEMVGYVMRDMQIKVGSCNNNPPNIIPWPDTCIVAGTLLDKTFKVTDPDNDIVTLNASGAPFSSQPPVASFASAQGPSPVTGQLLWQTTCSHIRRIPYQVTFKAIDDDPQIKLVDFKTYNITVVGPPPKNLTATPLGTSIKLVWNKSNCNNTSGNQINYYNVYRKNDCTPWVHGPCEIGVPASSGFVFIGKTTGPNDTTFLDNNGGNGLSHGVSYSYLVVAVYNEGNIVEGSYSYASNQVCAQLKRDVPLIINVDILSTSTNTGSCYVRWVKPLLTPGNLDTVAVPGPYEFRLSYKLGASGTYSVVNTVTKQFYAQLVQLSDTTFTHNNINTVSDYQYYKLDFYANNQFVGSAQNASSVFLTLAAGDRKIKLTWNHFVPWNNFKYFIYRKGPGQSTFNLKDSTTNKFYTDSSGLANRALYCYKVLSKGQYSDPSIYRPLLNNSQEVCASPTDLVAPCSPTLNILSDCNTGFVQLKWNNPNHVCADDVIKYYIYYKPTEDEDLKIIDSISNVSDTVYVFDNLTSIAGCYAVTAIDSSYNQSAMPEAVCVDNCPEFELPNVITINGDGINDFFKAIKVRYIKDIELKVYNRWGQLVYETTDPLFRWDGKVIQTKTLCSEGTYFYVCKVNEIRVKGIKSRYLKGWAEVFH